jgi:hypothetical protein
MPALFAGRFFYKGQHVYTDPDEAYRLRARYAEKHGPFGDDFLANVSLLHLKDNLMYGTDTIIDAHKG